MYIFYIDESGQREYGPKTSRYFVLCGLGVPDTEWKRLNDRVSELKNTYFKTPSVETKSAWLRHPSERKKRYIDTFGISEEDLREFIERIYDLIETSNIVLFASVIDKKEMQEDYVTPQNPSSIAYRLIFERFEKFLEQQAEDRGIVIFDKISEAAFVKKGYENLLVRQHLKYMTKGTDYVTVERIIEGLLFIPSVENNFIQLADLCAYNTFRQFRQFGEDWEKPSGKSLKTYKYFGRILKKFYVGRDDRLSGYGIKKFPDRGKTIWRLGDEDKK